MNFLAASKARWSYVRNRSKEKLWVKPALICVVSVAGVFLAKTADRTALKDIAPEVSLDALESILAILAASMLGVATFAVASMVAAYASTSSTATPRSFSLVIADDVSQNALSTFIGAFIFSIVGTIAVKNDFFGLAGRFALFLFTIMTFAMVVFTFVRWVDQIARLGRLGTTIDKVELATEKALAARRAAPTQGAMEASGPYQGTPIFATSVGYVQRLDVKALQTFAESQGIFIRVTALQGTLATPARPIAYVSDTSEDWNPAPIRQAFGLGDQRMYDQDPRFGLVVLSEIAGRALSPAVNDPGTAIDIIGTLLRLFTKWNQQTPPDADVAPIYDRVLVPRIDVHDMFEDAFTSIGRDGAASIEVSIRLQKALAALASLPDGKIQDAAKLQARRAFERARHALALEDEVNVVRDLAAFAHRDYQPNSPTRD